jgi:hypothetical protein
MSYHSNIQFFSWAFIQISLLQYIHFYPFNTFFLHIQHFLLFTLFLLNFFSHSSYIFHLVFLIQHTFFTLNFLILLPNFLNSFFQNLDFRVKFQFFCMLIFNFLIQYNIPILINNIIN